MKSIECPIIISPFAQHKELKTKLLETIESSPGSSLISDSVDENIAKTDWHIDSSIPREYLNLIKNPIEDHLKKSYNTIGVRGFTIHNVWYQQYVKNSTHGWHNHENTHYTNVYYLELSKLGPKPQIKNPMDLNEIITLDVQEGDILSLPAFIMHRSPVVLDYNRKTVISFNTSFCKVI
jgi:hypothetical protein